MAELIVTLRLGRDPDPISEVRGMIRSPSTSDDRIIQAMQRYHLTVSQFLHEAFICHRYYIIRFILAHDEPLGCHPNKYLRLAVGTGFETIVGQLIRKGADDFDALLYYIDQDLKDVYKQTMLDFLVEQYPSQTFLSAIRLGQVVLVKNLICQSSVNLNQGLLEAVRCRHATLIRLLISHGANNFGSALILAVERCGHGESDFPMIRYLAEWSLSPNYFRHAMEIAVWRRLDSLAEFLHEIAHRKRIYIDLERIYDRQVTGPSRGRIF